MRGLGDILAEARARGPEARWPVSVTTNQDGGHVSFSTGMLCYLPSRTIGRYTLPERLATEARAPLQLLFADPGEGLDEAFATDTADQVGLSISRHGSGHAVAHFTLISWAGSSFDVALEARDGTLAGTGPGIGTGRECSTFVIAFGEPDLPKPSVPKNQRSEQPPGRQRP